LQAGLISTYYFFPLWLGYVLTVDGLVLLRTRTSPLKRAGRRYPLWFVISAPFWWLFEAFNEVIDNWTYLTPWDYGLVGRTIIGSLSFSTVIPAVLTTAELVASFRGERWAGGPRLPNARRGLVIAHLSGWLMLLGMLVWPAYLFPLCWLSVYFILDPLARLAGARTVSMYAAEGNWGPVVNLALAGLICGWFWEMWNFLSMPKWVYTVPHVGFLKVWEMPLLGYGGYIPFAFEILAFYALVTALLPWMGASAARTARPAQIDREMYGHL
jgi:hypothetical protein